MSLTPLTTGRILLFGGMAVGVLDILKPILFTLMRGGSPIRMLQGIASGALDEHGERRSVFAKLPDGTPRLVAHLVARHVEEAGGRVDGVRGMPLGLPPLSFEDIQLVESWIAQGRPRSR